MSNNMGIQVVFWKSETKFFSGSVCQTSVMISSPYVVGVHTETTFVFATTCAKHQLWQEAENPTFPPQAVNRGLSVTGCFLED